MGDTNDLVDAGGDVVARMIVGSITNMSDEDLSFNNDEKIRLFITGDPPYNRSFDYGEEVNDNLPEEVYKKLLVDTFAQCSRLLIKMRVYSSSITRKRSQKFTTI